MMMMMMVVVVVAQVCVKPRKTRPAECLPHCSIVIYCVMVIA